MNGECLKHDNIYVHQFHQHILVVVDVDIQYRWDSLFFYFYFYFFLLQSYWMVLMMMMFIYYYYVYRSNQNEFTHNKKMANVVTVKTIILTLNWTKKIENHWSPPKKMCVSFGLCGCSKIDVTMCLCQDCFILSNVDCVICLRSECIGWWNSCVCVCVRVWLDWVSFQSPKN